MKNSVQRLLFKHIEEQIQAYLEQWQELQPLTESLCTPNMQAGAEAALAELLATYSVQGNIHGQLPGTLHATWGGKSENAPSLLLYIPIKQPAIKYLIPLFTWLIATATYQKIMGSLPIHIHCMLTTEEATVRQASNIAPTHGCLWYTEEQLRDDLPLFALGCKGCLRVELSIQTARVASPAPHDAIVPNALWRLVWALNSLKNEHEEILIPGFYDDLTPETDEHIAIIQELPDNAQQYVQALGVAQPLLGLQGFQFHYTHLLTPTCTLHELRRLDHNAEADSVPGCAQASVLFHLVPEQQPAKISQLLHEHLQVQGCTEVALRIEESRAPRKIAPEAPLALALQHACTAVYGSRNYLLPMSAGSYPFENVAGASTLPVIFDVSTISEKNTLAVGNFTQLTNKVKYILLLIHNMTNFETV